MAMKAMKPTIKYFVDNLVDDNINGDCDNEEGG